MVQWLAARQAGVEAGREAFCRDMKRKDPAWHLVDCSLAAAVHQAASAAVYHGCEVGMCTYFACSSSSSAPAAAARARRVLHH